MSCRPIKHGVFAYLLAVICCSVVLGQNAASCAKCIEWNKAQAPFRIFGNTYYVGTHGLSSVLITSPAGHVLIDGDLPQSVGQIVGNIRSLGFRVEDVKLILNSHVHFDHAGGIAELQHRSGARVVASQWSAEVLRKGGVGRGDPQYGTLTPIAAVKNVSVFRDGESLHLGEITITPHLTPGHTPGGTSWTWRTCEGSLCYDMVYADSLNPISAPEFRFTKSREYPHALEDFKKSFTFFETVSCDVLVTAHPGAIRIVRSLGLTGDVKPDPLMESGCRKLAEDGRERLRQRLAEEGKR